MKTTNNYDFSFLRLAVLGGAAVQAVLIDNPCDNSSDLVPCYGGGDGTDIYAQCQHCTHVSTINKPMWHNHGVWVDRCLDVNSYEYRMSNGDTDCFWDGNGCSNGSAESCFMGKGKAAVDEYHTEPWDFTSPTTGLEVKGVYNVQYTEIRSGPGEHGEELRNLGISRGLLIRGDAVCHNCPVPCIFASTTAFYAITPDPHGDRHYGHNGQGAEDFYESVGPKVAGQTVIEIDFDDRDGVPVRCSAAAIPAARVELKWRRRTYTFSPVILAGSNFGTCATRSYHLCGYFGSLRHDNTRCSGADHCKQKCCDCPVDSYYYAEWCPTWADYGYCDHWVDFMESYCGGSCCKIA